MAGRTDMHERTHDDRDWHRTSAQYKRHLITVILPFWHRAADTARGGVFTCYSNDGKRLVSKDKFVWSQGRFLWIWSKIADMVNRGLLPGNARPYYEQARRTARFLLDHALLSNGRCAFLLSETGEKIELSPGDGFDISIFADCFVIMGLAEYARLSGDDSAVEVAVELFRNVRRTVESGSFRSEPYPVPSGFSSHAVAMIMLNVSQELHGALNDLGHKDAEAVRECEHQYLVEILTKFRESDGSVRELVSQNVFDRDTVLFRHANPGHAIESMWMVMKSAARRGDSESITKAIRSIERAMEIGWDDEFGGIFRFVDWMGGPPIGRRIGHRYERLILDTWDMKLWWPHAEAMYATLLGYWMTKDQQMLRLHDVVAEYALKTFPNPDHTIGEWIQIRDRSGTPIDKVVALPVKDPYHIARSLLLIIELLSRELDGREEY